MTIALGSFEHCLHNLSATTIRWKKSTKNAAAESLISQGHVATIHWLREGGRTVSWYRGPLAPAAVPKQALPIQNGHASDSFLLFDTNTGMFNASYAAAWELGRQTALADAQFSADIYNYKSTLMRQAISSKQNSKLGSVEHLAIYRAQPTPVLPTTLLRKIADWCLLWQVPFNALVPDPDMLPCESLTHFTLDANWLNTFLQGALNVGFFPELEAELDFSNLWLDPDKPITGFIMRSRVVENWPHMHVDAQPVSTSPPTDAPAPKSVGKISDSASVKNSITALNRSEFPTQLGTLFPGTINFDVFVVNESTWWLVDYAQHSYYLIEEIAHELAATQHFTVPILRKETIGKGTMLVLFADQASALDFALKPGPLHSGFEPDTPTTYVKPLRNPGDGNPYPKRKSVVTITAKSGDFGNVLDMSKIAVDISKALQVQGYKAAFSAAEFGLSLMEGAPSVRFPITCK